MNVDLRDTPLHLQSAAEAIEKERVLWGGQEFKSCSRQDALAAYERGGKGVLVFYRDNWTTPGGSGVEVLYAYHGGLIGGKVSASRRFPVSLDDALRREQRDKRNFFYFREGR